METMYYIGLHVKPRAELKVAHPLMLRALP